MKAIATLGVLFMLAAYATGVARAAEARKHDDCTWVAAMAEAASFDLHNGVKLERVKVIMVEIAAQWGLNRVDALDLVKPIAAAAAALGARAPTELDDAVGGYAEELDGAQGQARRNSEADAYPRRRRAVRLRFSNRMTR